MEPGSWKTKKERRCGMYQIPSKLEGERFPLFKLEKLLKPKGYTIGGNWEYGQGYLDYKMANDEGYQFLRIPFTPLQGQALDYEGTAVELGTPFILSHVYQNHLDDHANTGNMSGSFNQFAEPEDKDGTVPEKYADLGRELVSELENILLSD
jgi:hypothetical protein